MCWFNKKKDKKEQLHPPLIGYHRISSPYGMRTHPITGVKTFHKGADYATPMDTPIYAIADAEAYYKLYQPNLAGNYIILEFIYNGEKYRAMYMHLDSSLDIVSPHKGQWIGNTGNTGASTGPHLHYQIDKLLADNTWEHIDPFSLEYEKVG